MRVGLYLPSFGGSPLQAGLHRGLKELGHTVKYYLEGPPYDCDLLLIFNMSAHYTGYAYPTFPVESLPFAFIDTAEYGYFRRLPNVVRQYANTFSPGAMAHDTKNAAEQTRLKQFLHGKSFPYFIREFHKAVSFPSGYHPIDYPLYCESVCHRQPNRDDYLRRPLDLYCCWGASHPWRLNITEAMRHHPCRSHVYVLDQDGPRRPQNEYFAIMEGSRCTVSYDGYGSGSFRMTEALVRTVLLQGPLSIVTRAPLVDGETCVMYDVVNDGEQFVSTNICTKLAELLTDPERSFRIYQQGYEHCNQHLSEKAAAAYVMDVIQRHDWTKPTQLDLT